MARPTINNVQLNEPVLTNLLLGYMQSDDRFVAMRAFPAVPVEKDSGVYPIFTKKYWFVDGLQHRAPGDTFQRGGYALETAAYETRQFALEHKIPDEVRANSQVPMDLEQAGLRWLAQQSLIRKEKAFAAAAFGAGAWGTTVTGGSNFTKWSDYSGSDPVNDVRTARRKISQTTGSSANTLVCGEIVYDKLINHPDIIDRLKYVERATEDNVRASLAAIFGIGNILVSLAIENTANVAQTEVMTPIIDDDALLLRVDSGATMFTPTGGKTFTWAGGGGEGAIARTYYEEQTNSDILQHKEQWDMNVTAADVGYEFVDCVD